MRASSSKSKPCHRKLLNRPQESLEPGFVRTMIRPSNDSVDIGDASLIQVKAEIPAGHLFTDENYRAKAPWLDTVPEAPEPQYNLGVSPDPFQQLDRNTVSLVDNHELEVSSEAEQIYPWGYINTPSKDDHHIGFNKYSSKEHTTLGYSSSYPGASGIFGEGIRGCPFNGGFWDRRQSDSSVSDFPGSPISGHTMQSEVDMLPDAQMDDGLTFAENFSHQGPSNSPQATSSSSASASVSAAAAGCLRRSITSQVTHYQASSPLAQEHTCPDSDDEVENEEEREDTKKPSKKQQTSAVSGSVPKGTRPFARHSKAGNVHYVVPAGADVRFTCTYPMSKKDGSRDTICGKTFEKTHKIRKHLIDEHMRFSPFQCDNCKKVFTRQAIRTRHLHVVKEPTDSNSRTVGTPFSPPLISSPSSPSELTLGSSPVATSSISGNSPPKTAMVEIRRCNNARVEPNSQYYLRREMESKLQEIRTEQAAVEEAIKLILVLNKDNRLETRKRRPYGKGRRNSMPVEEDDSASSPTQKKRRSKQDDRNIEHMALSASKAATTANGARSDTNSTMLLPYRENHALNDHVVAGFDVDDAGDTEMLDQAHNANDQHQQHHNEFTNHYYALKSHQNPQGQPQFQPTEVYPPMVIPAGHHLTTGMISSPIRPQQQHHILSHNQPHHHHHQQQQQQQHQQQQQQQHRHRMGEDPWAGGETRYW